MLERTLPAGCLLTKTASFLTSGEFNDGHIQGRSLEGHFFFLGTLLPFLRALESAMAIACLRLFTLPPFPPLPLFALPLFGALSRLTSSPEPRVLSFPFLSHSSQVMQRSRAVLSAAVREPDRNAYHRRQFGSDSSARGNATKSQFLRQLPVERF
jgi:hypothetical protein